MEMRLWHVALPDILTFWKCEVLQLTHGITGEGHTESKPRQRNEKRKKKANAPSGEEAGMDGSNQLEPPSPSYTGCF